jgi:uncharacterized protein YndB with AHSA1/START domain
MNKQGEVIQVGAVRFERRLPGDVERVWSHLTDCEKLINWFGDDGTIEPREGGAVWLMGGHIRGVVTQWKPHRRLAYTWNVFDPGDTESQHPESYLSFELTAENGEVVLTLFHLPIPERFDKQTRMGWHTFLDMLEAAVNGEAVKDRDEYATRNAALYDVDLTNLER